MRRWGMRGAASVTLVIGVLAGPTVATAHAATPSSVVVAAAGDIACDPSDSNFSGASSSTCQMAATANEVAAIAPSYVLPLGDIQYVNTTTQGAQPTLTQYQHGYGASWGQLSSRIPNVTIRPVTGFHDYGDVLENGASPLGNGAGYYQYFTGLGELPSSVTGASNDWYSYDIPVGSTAWHVVALDGECYAIPAGTSSSGCGAGSPEESWLANDLAAHQGQCILAYVHDPRWAWGADDPRYAAIWSDLVHYRVTAMLAGHVHSYERYAAMDANGNPSVYGVNEFVVGTGGDSLESIDKSQSQPAALRYSDATHFGVLSMTLNSSSMSFSFISTAGTTLDSGSLPCNPPTASGAPSVTSVTPTSGPSSGGTSITVTGTGFAAGSSVTVAGVPATNVSVSSPTSLTAVVPPGTSTGDVAVSNGSGTSPPTAGDLFTYTYAFNGYSIRLAASATSPSPGTAVTLTATANQDVGPTPYGMSIIDATTGVVLTHVGSGQVLTLSVSQAAASTRRYVAEIDSMGHAPVEAVSLPAVVTWATPSANAPTVGGVAPITGPSAGGTSVTVTGSGFTAGTTVAFGAQPASNVAVASATSLTATSPALPPGAAASVDVTVSNANGTSSSGPTDRYSYSESTNGYAVTLTASNTNPATGVATTLTAVANRDVGPTPYGMSIVDALTGAQLAHTGSGTTLTLSVTASVASTRRFTAQVDNNGGTNLQAASAPVSVTWNASQPTGPPPTVSNVGPGYGPAAGGNTVTVTGTGFTGDASVGFGSNSSPSVSVSSSTSLTAVVPAGSGTVHVVVTNLNGSSSTSVSDEYTYTFAANGYAVTLAASANQAAVGANVTLTATTNQDMGPTPYGFSIVDASTGTILAHAGSGTVLSVAVTATQAATRRFVAEVDVKGQPPIEAMSAPQILTWS